MSSSSNPSRPTMFPCATQVSLIEVGADDFDSKVKNQQQLRMKSLHRPGYLSSTWMPSKSSDAKEGVKRPVLQSVSEGLSFTDEVNNIRVSLLKMLKNLISIAFIICQR